MKDISLLPNLGLNLNVNVKTEGYRHNRQPWRSEGSLRCCLFCVPWVQWRSSTEHPGCLDRRMRWGDLPPYREKTSCIFFFSFFSGRKRLVRLSLKYLQHVVDDVELDDRLASDQVVHHGVVDVMGHGEAQHQDQALQHITHLCWLQQSCPAARTENKTPTLRCVGLQCTCWQTVTEGIVACWGTTSQCSTCMRANVFKQHVVCGNKYAHFSQHEWICSIMQTFLLNF